MTTSSPSLLKLSRSRLVITGVVQGVGFRPFIYRLARSLNLGGWVLNSTEGVIVEVEGKPDVVDRFIQAIPQQAPPRARIERIDRTILPPIGYRAFAIESSLENEGQFVLVSPDICVCDDCLREMRDPSNRRYRYPFINCTNCGPRFTIVAEVPYDRPKTTMSCFTMCPDCDREYHDPSDRRFHAQPNACPICGPHAWLVEKHTGSDSFNLRETDEDTKTERRGDSETEQPLLPIEEGQAESSYEAIKRARSLISQGLILAVKGLGGFHLACDATNEEAVAELRRRKRRTDKPFAIMAPNAEVVAGFCHLNDAERRLLESPQRPIVLLRRKAGSAIAPSVAPHNRYLGVMLPYTPLHYLLIGQDSGGQTPKLGLEPEEQGLILVMTSGNLSEEPIATGNREALERLDSLADAFLIHNRDIQVRCDDSVTRVFRGQEAVIRRSRGYAPFPVRLGFEARDILACGGELKNTFCITKGSYAFLSQHIGDLENKETLISFADSVKHFQRLFRLEIEAIAHDMHPEYLSTRYALDIAEDGARLPLVPVQHHHAHVAACLAENGVDEEVLGISFDGTGYGDDGHLWGGEFLVCDFAGYRRAAHLKYLPLPGGEAAIRQPYRMAASYLLDTFGIGGFEMDLPPLRGLKPAERSVLAKQIQRLINSPLTSSIGRLFDAVSSLIGVRQVVNYEGQAAIELEMVADGEEKGGYRWDISAGDTWVINPAPTIRQIVDDFNRGVPAEKISARFHNTVADMIVQCCVWLRDATGISTAALSGGVFQNLFLLERACSRLESAGFKVLIHHQVPTNDGGLSLGQAVIANKLLSDGGRARHF